MLSLTIAGGIFLLDYKIKEHIDCTRLQGSKEEVLGGRLLLRNCHNKDKILGKVKSAGRIARSLQQPVWAVWQGNTGTSFSTAEISLAEPVLP